MWAAGGRLPEGWHTVFEWVTLGRSLTYLGLEAVAYFALTLWLDYDSRHGASAAAAVQARAWLAE